MCQRNVRRRRAWPKHGTLWSAFAVPALVCQITCFDLEAFSMTHHCLHKQRQPIQFALQRDTISSLRRRWFLAHTSFAAASGAISQEAHAEEPTEEDFSSIRKAFAAMATDPSTPGAKAAVEEAEALFGRAITRWDGPLLNVTNTQRQVERAQLHMGRAQVRLNLNDIAGGERPEKAAQAVQDLDIAIGLMNDEFKQNPDKPMFSEYPSTLVKRGLAKEELKQWEGAVQDYTMAIEALRPPIGTPDKPLRGNARIQQGDGLGANPLILNFRGNALSRLGRYDEARFDYMEATSIFENDREMRQASLSRANEALALFGAGDTSLAIKTMEQVIRKDPGVTDAHVALAAAYWVQNNVVRAESEWKFACENVDTGCSFYKDLNWVSEIRRWPPTLVSALQDFLKGRARG